MLIYRAVKTKLKLTNDQRQELIRWGGAARYVYNWALAQRKEYYEEYSIGVTLNQQQRQLTLLKKEQPWLSNHISKWILEDSLRRLDIAFQNFFRKLKIKCNYKCGYPKFKRKNDNNDSFSIPVMSGKQITIAITGNKIKLPVLGIVKTYEKLNFLGKEPYSVTISQEGNDWYISISYRENIEPAKNTGTDIGIDLGIKNTVTTSEAKTFQLTDTKRIDKKVKNLQKKHSRCKSGSKRKTKVREKLRKANKQLVSARTDFLHKLTTNLVKNHKLIAIETLDLIAMRKNHGIASCLQQIPLGEFIRQLVYKAPVYGCTVVAIDKWFPSSQLCNVCGHRHNKLKLSEREWQCPQCKTINYRDVNAALNILTEGYSAIMLAEQIALQQSNTTGVTMCVDARINPSTPNKSLYQKEKVK